MRSRDRRSVRWWLALGAAGAVCGWLSEQALALAWLIPAQADPAALWLGLAGLAGLAAGCLGAYRLSGRRLWLAAGGLLLLRLFLAVLERLILGPATETTTAVVALLAAGAAGAVLSLGVLGLALLRETGALARGPAVAAGVLLLLDAGALGWTYLEFFGALPPLNSMLPAFLGRAVFAAATALLPAAFLWPPGRGGERGARLVAAGALALAVAAGLYNADTVAGLAVSAPVWWTTVGLGALGVALLSAAWLAGAGRLVRVAGGMAGLAGVGWLLASLLRARWTGALAGGLVLGLLAAWVCVAWRRGGIPARLAACLLGLTALFTLAFGLLHLRLLGSLAVAPLALIAALWLGAPAGQLAAVAWLAPGRISRAVEPDGDLPESATMPQPQSQPGPAP